LLLQVIDMSISSAFCSATSSSVWRSNRYSVAGITTCNGLDDLGFYHRRRKGIFPSPKPVQTDPAAHLVSSNGYRGWFRRESGRSIALTTHPHPALRLGESTAVPLNHSLWNNGRSFSEVYINDYISQCFSTGMSLLFNSLFICNAEVAMTKPDCLLTKLWF